MFASLVAGETPDWLQFSDVETVFNVKTENQQTPQDALSLTSPTASDSKGSIFAVLPALSFESDSSALSSEDHN